MSEYRKMRIKEFINDFKIVFIKGIAYIVLFFGSGEIAFELRDYVAKLTGTTFFTPVIVIGIMCCCFLCVNKTKELLIEDAVYDCKEKINEESKFKEAMEYYKNEP